MHSFLSTKCNSAYKWILDHRRQTVCWTNSVPFDFVLPMSFVAHVNYDFRYHDGRFIFTILIFITHSLVTVQILTVQNTHRFWKYSKQTKDQLFVSFTNEVKMGFFHINTIAVFWLNFDFQAYENVYSGCVETVIIFFVSYRLFVWFLLTLINCTRKEKKTVAKTEVCLKRWFLSLSLRLKCINQLYRRSPSFEQNI